ncbi:hypothetical protein PGTUg99_010007 [Puccinia graminis f. sp. tritici]|uniref:Uncharacterized protein n=1 Tax=Puccinia graminis f. sp. tritici TaxID=56615 RepID=A0A5B0MCF6_PUCGR|nr:hypothetical protein PGTUg99_010007 [Puccinia graminis f. sp. tritici]
MATSSIATILRRAAITTEYELQTCSVSGFLAVFRYATLRYSAFSGKSGQKPLKTAVAQRSGPFFAAHTRSVSGVVAEFRYATLIANSDSAALRYTNRYG